MHILMSILTIAGIVLLILLAVAAALVLALLFVPVRYGGRGVKQGERLEVRGHVSWMFRLVYVRAYYREKKAGAEVYILGIPLLRLKKYLEARKHKKSVKSRTPAENPRTVHKKPTVAPAEQPPFEKSSVKESPLREAEPISRKEKPEKQGGPGERLRKIRFTIRNFCVKIKEWYSYFRTDTFQEAFRTARERGKKILKHVLPKKVRGYIRFGFEDPSTTGQLLGAAGLLLPVIPEKLRLIPDFQEQCLEADVTVRGRIVLFVVLKNGLAFYRNRAVQKVIRKFQHKEA